MKTPEEYCDGITGIAFDRKMTKAAFEAGRAAESAERDDDLTAAYMAGIERGRDSLRREIDVEAVRELVGAAQHILRVLDHEALHANDLDKDRLRSALTKFGGQP